MPENNNITVSVDTDANLVRLAFSGDIGAAELRRQEKTIFAALAAARRGFFLLTDLSQVNSMDVDCMPSISRTMETARRHGLARVVRIIPDPSKDIGFNIMSLFHYRSGVKIITCQNQAEADQALK